jgi:hypothetical protein
MKTKRKISRKLKGHINSRLSRIRMSNSKKLSGSYHYRKIGTIVNISNEKYIKVKEHLWIAYYRYLVEKYIGYKLKKGWIVHHIDGDHKNSRLSNLYIFIKRGIHQSFETLIRYKIIDRFILKSNLKEFKR